MGARLLDMGEVAPVRSQSLFRALASLAEPPGLPLLALAIPASELVLIGTGGELAPSEIDSCRNRGVPVLPWPGESVRRLDRKRLVFQLVVLESAALERGWTSAEDNEVADLVARACRRAGLESARADATEISSADGAIGAVEVCTSAGRVVVLGDLAVAVAGRGGLEPAALAEGLVSTFEEAMGLEFEPSLPTPDELEAIYLNDEMLAREERTGLGRTAAAGELA